MDKPDWGENFDRLRSLIADATGAEAADGEVIQSFLVGLSRRVGRTFPPAIRDDLSPDAITSLLVERVNQFRLDRGHFRTWCYTVLTNHAISLHRRLGRDALGRASTVQEGLEVESDARMSIGVVDHLEADERLEMEFGRIRQVLDQVAWEPEGTERVDYYAVFVVHLRLALEARLRKLGIEDPESFACPSRFIEFCLPWRESERHRRFESGLPPLGPLWAALGDAIDRSGATFSFDQFHAVLATLDAEGAGRLTADRWNQWTKRARDKVRSKAGPESWDRTFAHWFPDRSRGVGPKGTTEVPR